MSDVARDASAMSVLTSTLTGARASGRSKLHGSSARDRVERAVRAQLSHLARL